MGSEPNFDQLTQYAVSFTGLTPERQATLQTVADKVVPLLVPATDLFYERLLSIPETAPFLEGRVESLKQSHLKWMEGLFTGPFDTGFTQRMYHVGDIHVKVKLPVEFMAGAMTMVNNELIKLVIEAYSDDMELLNTILVSINAVTGFSLFVMQQAYHESSLAEELNKFLQISGVSEELFHNMAKAYSD